MGFDKRNVMVGVLRNRQQLELNVKHKFYHIPEEWVPEYSFPIEYIALYQEPRLFDEDESGIYLYGRVNKVELVPRHRITQVPTSQNPNKLYYKFHVDEWNALDRPVPVGNILPDVNLFASEYQLFNAEDMSELFIQSWEYWTFYCVCKRYFPEAFLFGKGDIACGVKFGILFAEWNMRRIIIYKGKKRIAKMKLGQVSEEKCIEIFEGIKEKENDRIFG